MKSKTMKYKFKDISPEEFICECDIENIESSMFNLIYSKSLGHSKAKSVNVGDSTPDLVKSFEIDDKHKKLLRTVMSKNIKDVFKQVEKDFPISIVRHDVSYAKFNKENDFWNVNITLSGDYKRL